MKVFDVIRTFCRTRPKIKKHFSNYDVIKNAQNFFILIEKRIYVPILPIKPNRPNLGCPISPNLRKKTFGDIEPSLGKVFKWLKFNEKLKFNHHTLYSKKFTVVISHEV
jgi:hypothetical protein